LAGSGPYIETAIASANSSSQIERIARLSDLLFAISYLLFWLILIFSVSKDRKKNRDTNRLIPKKY